ncbi:related to acetylcholinesterase precursor [Phialocephala subalpina]|uniref:Carboxylic ester hydrolase n=1 Tax=Phialocephala subalpina TaxID=576137 RepID=A0A1L7XWE0_9HELO|nr:related to acetylcholinesterase precursor [Phialocephala subalpina]
MYRLRFALFLLLLSSTIATAKPTGLNYLLDACQVLTSSGIVQGHVASWPENTSVFEFLGIPFAQPPLGQLRFAAPQAYQQDTSSVFVADKCILDITVGEYLTKFQTDSWIRRDCMQYTGSASQNVSAQVAAYGYGMGGGNATDPHSYSEDCLTVNVWAKPTGQKNKAVMVWIYGGAFSAGTSNAPFYNGALLAEDEDVIVNLGLLDQRLAVEWVRDNIAGFGGDASRITLFGESAGGSSVDYYSYAWTEDPIVTGFIAESGTAFILHATNESDYSGWYNISEALGCGGEEVGEQTIQCVRDVNATALMNAVGQQASGGISTTFGPVADGKVVFADVKNRSAAGDFIQRPLFVGNNDNELGLILALGDSLFGGGNPGNLSTPDLIKFGSAAEFVCPAALTAKDRAVNGVPTWRYRYMGVWNNTALVPGMGAYHSSEIPFVFGTNELRPNSTTDTPEEANLAKIMVHAWAEFAKDPQNGLNGLNWPQYNPNGTTLIRLGYNNQSEPNIGNGTDYDGLCSILGP